MVYGIRQLHVVCGDVQLKNTPWRAILTSMPVHAIIVASYCRQWVLFTMIISLPKYFRDVFHCNMTKVSEP